MAGLVRVTVKRIGTRGLLDKQRQRVKAPLLRGNLGFQAQRVIRRLSTDSIAAQFNSAATFSGDSRVPWKTTKPFGSRRRAATMRRSGSLKRAWTTEGAGSITTYSSNSIRIAVDTRQFPMGAIMQRSRATVVRARRRLASGRLAMQIALGMKYGTWITEQRLLAGLTIHPRPVGISKRLAGDVAHLIAEYVATGRKTAGI